MNGHIPFQENGNEKGRYAVEYMSSLVYPATNHYYFEINEEFLKKIIKRYDLHKHTKSRFPLLLCLDPPNSHKTVNREQLNSC